MTLLVAVLAQAVHLGLVLAVALLLAGLVPRLRARMAGMPAPELLDALRGMRRLLAKRLVRGEPGAMQAAVAPLVALSAILAAAMLVPGFTAGLALAPAGDPLVVAGLLALGRLAEALLAEGEGFDAADPALLLALCAAALPGVSAWVPGAAALLLVVGVRAEPGLPWREGSAGDLAVLELSRALRRVVFLALVVAIVLPAGPAWWPGAMLLWMAELVGLGALLALVEVLLPAATRRRTGEVLAAALLLAWVAMLGGLAGGAPP